MGHRGYRDDEWFCPVCWRPVEQTPGGFIAGHFDTAYQYCRGAFEPFYIAIREPLR